MLRGERRLLRELSVAGELGDRRWVSTHFRELQGVLRRLECEQRRVPRRRGLLPARVICSRSSRLRTAAASSTGATATGAGWKWSGSVFLTQLDKKPRARTPPHAPSSLRSPGAPFLSQHTHPMTRTSTNDQQSSSPPRAASAPHTLLSTSFSHSAPTPIARCFSRRLPSSPTRSISLLSHPTPPPALLSALTHALTRAAPTTGRRHGCAARARTRRGRSARRRSAGPRSARRSWPSAPGAGRLA